MSTDLLGLPIDIHGGGADLSFPHHECEIAQIEPIYSNQSFVRYWMHVAMVYHEGSKMSKSIGNLIMVRDLLQEYSADSLRLYLGSHRYRDSWSHSLEELRHAQKRAQKILEAATIQGGNKGRLDPEPFKLSFLSAMEDDLNTSMAIETLSDLAGQIIIASLADKSVIDAQVVMREISRIFGLRLNSNLDSRIINGWNEHLRRFPIETPAAPIKSVDAR
jgi:L-cysteine:1D-myo-inositol 2-amino-2-deoxy-alpha-D-glucopyranoside ligase